MKAYKHSVANQFVSCNKSHMQLFRCSNQKQCTLAVLCRLNLRRGGGGCRLPTQMWSTVTQIEWWCLKAAGGAQ